MPPLPFKQMGRNGMLDAAFQAARKGIQEVPLVGGAAKGLPNAIPGRAQMFADFTPPGKFGPVSSPTAQPKLGSFGGNAMGSNYAKGREDCLTELGLAKTAAPQAGFYEVGVQAALQAVGLLKTANFPGAQGGGMPGGMGGGGMPGGMPGGEDQQIEQLLAQMPPEELAQLLGGQPDQTAGALGAMPEPTLEEIIMKLPPQEQQVIIQALQGGAGGGGAPPPQAPPGGGSSFGGGQGGPPGGGGGNPFGGGGEKAEKPGPFQPGEKKEKGEGGKKEPKSEGSSSEEKPAKKEKKESKDEE